ncbi:MAG: fumarylacetoacetate hydrolase family protein [Gemmatimonadetes bacterium]|jgi:2-keto-4-pentenoate hydratase/2-oxohepta-3-ene-1,7-dioic acid hydratase in catechol pathway|nr:fumarylacetoacetate hydrolase family protein [Gemmatimonadota bacterium]|tara:strand:+ start:9474 stop:10352 length:879 start_codon:yes stop_codon:yes gene_type:complete
MRFLNFHKDGEFKLGLKTQESVLDVETASSMLGMELPCTYDTVVNGNMGGFSQWDSLIEEALGIPECCLDENSLKVGPAVINPHKVICVGLNYREHAAEAGMDIPNEPVLFNKFNNSIAAPGQDIDITGLVRVDYEAELAFVMGEQTRRVSVDNALDKVFGYCTSNDISERELQFRSGQWLLGKALDGFLPIGPYLVTSDEVPDPQDLSIRGWLNGEIRQDSNTSDMIFTVAEIISYISRYITLDPGDVVITGTPPGVIMGREDKTWMTEGDSYAVEIGNLGKLSNTMRSGT